MQPLTHTEWAKHFVELRPYVLKEFPEVDERALQGARGDWDALVALVQRSTGMSADLVVNRLRKLDVAEMGYGTGNSEEEPAAEGQASLAQLRLGDGFSESERDRVVDRLSQLNRRLKRFPADGTEIVLSVKDRDTPAQHLRLEISAPHFAPMVATSEEGDLMAALADVRHDISRQLNDAIDKRKGAR